jgi:hypothetical protein
MRQTGRRARQPDPDKARRLIPETAGGGNGHHFFGRVLKIAVHAGTLSNTF